MKSITTFACLLILMMTGCNGGGVTPFSDDKNPPEWDNEIGIIEAVPGDGSVTIRFGSATDLLSPPVKYLIFMDEDNNPWDTTPLVKDNNDDCTFTNFENGRTYYITVRCMDSAVPPNIDSNHKVISVTPNIPQISYPLDVTPYWLNFDPKNIVVDGNYAFMASGINGLLIFDISDPLHPVGVKTVDTPVFAWDLALNDGYAFVADEYGLIIIDVDPVDSASVVKIIQEDFGYAPEILLWDKYAFVKNTGLSIFNVDPPPSTHSIHNFPLGALYGFHVADGYMYSTYIIATLVGSAYKPNFPPIYEYQYYFSIHDVDPPESTHEVKRIEIPFIRYNESIDIKDGFAYITDGDLVIIDIDPIESLSIVKTINTLGTSSDIKIVNDYAYVADDPCFEIINISDPTSAEIIKTIDMSCPDSKISLIDESSAYISGGFGLKLATLSPPESASAVEISKSMLNSTSDIYVTNGYAYVADKDLKIIDIDPLQPITQVLKTVYTPSDLNSVFVKNGYAYATGGKTVQIFDVDPPDSASIVKSIDTPSPASDAFVTDKYAYIAIGEDGLMIVDITSPESASPVKTVDTPGEALDVFVDDGYAYVAIDNAGLDIIDIDPPESAAIVSGVATDGLARGISVANGYAFIADGNYGVKIIDIDPPESANIVKAIDTGLAHGVFADNGFLYVADDMKGLMIIDITPPESASIIHTIDTPDHATKVFVDGDYAYVADMLGGLRIIKLM